MPAISDRPSLTDNVKIADTVHTYLDFEKSIADLEGKIRELRSLEENGSEVSLDEDIERLETKVRGALRTLYGKLTPWQKTQVARHPERPRFADYVAALISEFTPLAGDRRFGEDPAMVAGLGWLEGRAVAIIGQEKGHDTDSRLKHNFGMALPEGYRKAVRIMDLAERFGLPVISLIDTAGAYPGIEAEARGQAEAIARSTARCLDLRVPNVAVIIGEGGSGGAVAIGAANRVLMLEHAIYTVASPEASASILWRDAGRAKDAAAAMRITAQDLLTFGVIDEIIPEPPGGGHRHRHEVIAETGKVLAEILETFAKDGGADWRDLRRQKYLEMTTNL